MGAESNARWGYIQRMRVLVLLALAALAAPPSTPAETDAIAKADAAAMRLGKTLKERVISVLTAQGPVAAISVCSAEAPAVSASIGVETGAKLGRSSLRTRNPQNAGPDWVQAWLKEQGERKAEGVKGLATIEQTPTGKVARVIKPIAIEEPCLKCHGAPDAIHPDVVGVLKERYPQDAAKGYALGDLRGALWAELPVP